MLLAECPSAETSLDLGYLGAISHRICPLALEALMDYQSRCLGGADAMPLSWWRKHPAFLLPSRVRVTSHSQSGVALNETSQFLLFKRLAAEAEKARGGG